MNLDITFCNYKKCKNKECERNQSNYNFSLYAYHPISISNFEKCEFWEEAKQ